MEDPNNGQPVTSDQTTQPVAVETIPIISSPAEPIPPTPVVPPPAQRRGGIGKWLALGLLVVLIMAGGAYGATKLDGKPSRPAAIPAAAIPDKHVLKVGTIIDENGVVADKAEFAPFISYLVSQLHDQGITKGQFVPDTSVSDMAKLMREGKVDMYVDSIFPVFVADRLASSQLIANRWKEGVEKYHSAIFVKSASSIKTTDDLKGKIIAFDSSTSTTGYFLPKAELIKLGYTLTEKQKTTDPVAADEIGYTFVHGSVFDDVQNGVTPAGAESEQEVRDHFGASFDQQYHIVATTPDVLRFLVTGRKDLSPGLRAQIKTVLLGMDQTPAGQDTLKKFGNTAKFSAVSADSDAAYGEIQNLTDSVEKEIVQGGVGTTQTSH